MIKRPPLYLIEGALTHDERRIYRLREGRAQRPLVEEQWPASGEWRDLVRRLVRNPVERGKS